MRGQVLSRATLHGNITLGLRTFFYPLYMHVDIQMRTWLHFFYFNSTGKRNITGMMNDASNSLARMYLNTVKDFWRQATIDYILGKGLEGS